jgi:hypothetical protein
VFLVKGVGGAAGKLTFLPSGMVARSTSTLAWARTSAEADMLTRKSVGGVGSWFSWCSQL